MFTLKKINFVAIRYITIFIFCTIGLIVRAVIFPQNGLTWHFFAFSIQFIDLTFIWESMRWLNNILNKKVPFENGVVKRLIYQFLITCMAGIAIIYPVLLMIERISPFELTAPFKFIIIIAGLLMLLAVNLGYIGSYFFEKWKESLLRASILEKEKSVVQYQNLINQLNPHFFFNSLTSLNSLIFKDQQLASDFLQQLSKTYRYMLENKDKELVTLNSEINFVTKYIDLLQTRFSKGLHFSITIEEDAYEKSIVPVSLQIMIENALKHNIIDEDSPLFIQIFTENNYLCIENNIQKKNNIEDSHSQGLKNYKHLYQYLSPLRPVEAIANEGKFKVKIPLL